MPSCRQLRCGRIVILMTHDSMATLPVNTELSSLFMSQIVYVKSIDGRVLRPTIRCDHVRRLLKNKLAKVVSVKPFQIQLLYKEKEIYESPREKNVLGIDPGRQNIGISVVTESGKEIYSAKVTTRNKEIPDLMKERALHRRMRRQYHRQMKRRRAKKCKTTTTFANGRILPGCEKPIYPKDIKNSEARFLNRKRAAGWFTPSVRQLIQTHINLIKKIEKLLPIDQIAIELNKFAFVQMENGECRGLDFQNGRLKGYKNKYEYIDARQNSTCCLCEEAPIEHYHHLILRSEGGSDLPENLIGVCKECHEKIHKGKLKTKIKGIKKKYHHLSVLNQAIPYIIKEIKKRWPTCNLYTGRDTAEYRERYSISKDHNNDAACIAAIDLSIDNLVLTKNVYTIKQYRNHSRQRIHAQYERSYYGEGKCIAKNRKHRCEQRGDSLESWVKSNKKLPIFISDNKVRFSRNRNKDLFYVCKSTRQYNNVKNDPAGSIFIYKEKRYILASHKSSYLLAEGSKKKCHVNKCKIIKKNDSLMYL